jgi:hypothetical protein
MRRLWPAKQWAAYLVCWSLLAWLPLPALSATGSPSPSDVEAAYLYNFGKFIRWSGARTLGPMQICIAGKDPFGETLPLIVKDQRIDGQPLTIRYLTSPDEGRSCAILYLNTADPVLLRQYLAAVAGEQTLTVSERPDFLTEGGIIQFVLLEDRVRFAVNLNAAERNHLTLSSELLKVAVRVVGKASGGGQ